MTKNDEPFSSQHWWYEHEGISSGPVSGTELLALIEHGTIREATLVWSGELKTWTPANRIPDLPATLVADEPPPLPGRGEAPIVSEEKDNSANSPQDRVSKGEPFWSSAPREYASPSPPNAGPWPRFFARIFDLWWETIVIGSLVGLSSIFFPPSWSDFLTRNELLFALMVLPVALWFDALLASLFGNSPGKAILGIKVFKNGEATSSFSVLASRNTDLWVAGLAFGIPIVNLFTMAAAHKRLKQGDKTKWDQDSRTDVLRTADHPIRWVLFFFAFVALVIFIGALSTIGEA